MSRHRSHVVRPLRFSTVVKAISASVVSGVLIGVLQPLGPLAAYILGM